MILTVLDLKNFRNYTNRSFEFSDQTTLIIGPNTSGKTNILEAISLLSLGKSMRGVRASDMVKDGEEIGFIKGLVDDLKLEVILTVGHVLDSPTPAKKFLVNGISKRQINFVGHLKASVFEPEDLELVHSSPQMRRNFLDDVLIQTDRSYRLAHTLYEKALRHRNSILRQIKDLPAGRQGNLDLDYWDKLLIEYGAVITDGRERLIRFLNNQESQIGNFFVEYDKSLIDEERLHKYYAAEREAEVTLIGPQRDDFTIQIRSRSDRDEIRNLSTYGSRGEQRMAVLWLKMGELEFLAQQANDRPTLLLDDIFSELDEEHITIVSKSIDGQQTIITTTHQEFVPKTLLRHTNVIELKS